MAGGAREPCAGCGGVTGRVERRTRGARRAELEAPRIDVARRVTARAVAVEAADGEVIGGLPGDRDRVAGRRAGEGSGVRAMAAQAAGDSLVSGGDRVERVVAGRRVALEARRAGRNVVGGARGALGESRRIVTLTAIARRRVQRIELRRGPRVPGRGIGARVHADEVGGLV